MKARRLRAIPNVLSLLRLIGAAALAFLPLGGGFWPGKIRSGIT